MNMSPVSANAGHEDRYLSESLFLTYYLQTILVRTHPYVKTSKGIKKLIYGRRRLASPAPPPPPRRPLWSGLKPEAQALKP